MNACRVRRGDRGLQAQGLSLPGYGLDLEVRPYPLAVRSRDALHALAGEDISGFLERMAASKVAGLRLH